MSTCEYHSTCVKVRGISQMLLFFCTVGSRGGASSTHESLQFY